MQLHELKKAKPVTTKSSGTDDPSKYVGGWEEYDTPQGINDRQDPKVLAMEVTEDDGVESLYHVTFTKHVPGILQKGLEQFQPSNWARRDAGTRYNSGCIKTIGCVHRRLSEPPKANVKATSKLRETERCSVFSQAGSVAIVKEPAGATSSELARWASVRSRCLTYCEHVPAPMRRADRERTRP